MPGCMCQTQSGPPICAPWLDDFMSKSQISVASSVMKRRRIALHELAKVNEMPIELMTTYKLVTTSEAPIVGEIRYRHRFASPDLREIKSPEVLVTDFFVAMIWTGRKWVDV